MMSLDIRGLAYYIKKDRIYKIIDDFTLKLLEGSISTVYGDKYSGKYLIPRMIIKLIKPSKGEVIYKGKDILKLPKKELKIIRRKIQLIFADPISLFDEGLDIADNIRWIGEVAGVKDFRWIFTDVLRRFGLPEEYLNRYPTQVSIYHRRLISIARALILDPDVLILENPTILIDWGRRSELTEFIKYIHREYGVSILIFTSDLHLLKNLGDYVGVLHMGRLIEYGDRDSMIKEPMHPYVKWLMKIDPYIMEVEDIREYPMNILNKFIAGCRYFNCNFRRTECGELSEIRLKDRMVKCVLYK